MSFEISSLSNVSLTDFIPSFSGLGQSGSRSFDLFETVGEVFLPSTASLALGFFRNRSAFLPSQGGSEGNALNRAAPAMLLGAMALLLANMTLKNPILKVLEKSLEKSKASRFIVTSPGADMAVFRLGFWGSDSYMTRNLQSHILVTRGDRGILGRLSAWRMERAMTQHLRSSGADLSTLGFGRDPINSHFKISGKNIDELWKALGFYINS